MNLLALGRWSCALFPSIPLAQATVWQTTDGRRIEGSLSDVYGPLAIIAGQ